VIDFRSRFRSRVAPSARTFQQELCFLTGAGEAIEVFRELGFPESLYSELKADVTAAVSDLINEHIAQRGITQADILKVLKKERDGQPPAGQGD
jgi:hypothetical protein